MTEKPYVWKGSSGTWWVDIPDTDNDSTEVASGFEKWREAFDFALDLSLPRP